MALISGRASSGRRILWLSEIDWRNAHKGNRQDYGEVGFKFAGLVTADICRLLGAHALTRPRGDGPWAWVGYM